MVAHLTMVECVVIVIGMRYKVVFLDMTFNKWCHVIIHDRHLFTGEIHDEIMDKYDRLSSGEEYVIYSITAIEE